MKDKLKAALTAAGADLVGYADLRVTPPSARDNMPFAVSIAVALDPQVIAEITNGPTIRYWEEYGQVNTLLAEIATRAAIFLQTSGFKAKALVPTTVGFDPALQRGLSYNPGTLAATFPHKTAATLSGIGWIGKCALLVTRKFGSAVRLTTVFTDAVLPAGNPVTYSRCGNCTACIETCPGHAPSGIKWQAGISREAFFDAFRCRDTAFAQAEKIGIQETICGRCIAVCPWTRKYLRDKDIPLREDR